MEDDAPENIDELHRRWQERSHAWNVREETYLEYGRRALEFGHPSLALDILREGLSLFPDNSEMIFRSALALARAGSTRAAERLLAPLLGSLSTGDPLSSEILSLAGRLYKDRYQKIEVFSERRAAARESARYYRRAFEESALYFPGINAATMTCLAGDLEQGCELAKEVLELCGAELASADASDYWLPATIAEANLLLGRPQEANDWYRKAAQIADQRFGGIASMRRQVRMICDCVEVDPVILQALQIPNIVAFVGHMIDHPGQSPARFPPDIEARVAVEIREALERIGAGFGYCSAACGSDILFAEAMLERGAEVHVVLPFKRDDFIGTSVAFAGDGWVRRFDELLDRATSVSYATEEGHLGDDILFKYTGDLINGMALLRGVELDAAPILLSVMDPDGGGRVGGTTGTVKRWQSRGGCAEIIDIAAIRNELGCTTGNAQDSAPTTSPESDASEDEFRRSPRAIRAMLFADMVGFSKLGEECAPTFFIEFLGQISEVIRTSAQQPAFCNTWGDGLYIVFDGVAGAADFAVRLRDVVVNKNWTEIGLPEETNIRIGVHAGPVYRGRDPIIEKDSYFGSHVTRAARIEPVTTPGSVFVSEQAACLLAVEDQDEFTCDYLGVMNLAKDFGSGALYRLRRAREAE